MATPMTAGQFLHLLQVWKIPYREVAGWPTRNRTDPTEGRPWGPVHGILLHHTGDDAPDSADQRVLVNGRSDLPGPLCHWGMDDNGTVVLIGWGRANHAGRGASNVLSALIADREPPRPGPDSIDGNAHLYGQETMYSGLHRMTPAAYLSTVAVFAAVCSWHGWTANSCIGHKEWTGRKIDPGSLSMAAFRDDVERAILAGPPKDIPKSNDSTDDSTGTGDDMGDREVLSYAGKTYERRGFFVRYIPDSQTLHALIDPAPKGLGLPKRDAGVADFIGLVDVDKLELKLSDTNALTVANVKSLADLGQRLGIVEQVIHAPNDEPSSDPADNVPVDEVPEPPR